MLAGPRHVIEAIDKLIPILREALNTLQPAETVVVLDSQPSWSGRTAAKLRKELNITVTLSRNADKTIIELAEKGYIAATSDITILTRIRRAFDLAGYTIQNLLRTKVNNIPHLLNQQHHWWCSEGGPVA